MPDRREQPGPAAAFLGRTVANWKLKRLLGEGAFGAVYEAEHVNEGPPAAVKILHPTIAINADMRRRFLKEARAASLGGHEHVIQIFDVGVTSDGLCYLVMERLRGRTLGQCLAAEGPLDEGRAARIAIQIARALKQAHEAGVVHRDLKPDNVFLVSREENPEYVKVLDFGVARVVDTSGTKSGVVIGTPCYMAPEQWHASDNLDGRADIYALGVMLYEMLVGEPPLHAANPMGWMYAHLNHPIPDPSMRAIVSPAMAALILRMLAKDRAARPASMIEIVQALRMLRPVTRTTAVAPTMVDSSPELLRTLPPRTQTPPAQGAPSDLPYRTTLLSMPPDPVALTRRRNRRAAWAVAIVAPILIGSGVTWFVTRQNDVSPSIAPAKPDMAPVAEHPTSLGLPEGFVAFGPDPAFPIGWDAATDPMEKPAHAVFIKRFALSKYEVSFREFKDWADGAGEDTTKILQGIDNFDDTPVVLLDRDMASRFCKLMYVAWGGGRLPTEEEWEYAARDGNPAKRYPWGNRFDAARVNAGAGRDTVNVRDGRAGATGRGLMHMVGNAAEWTSSTVDGKAIVRGGGADSRPEALSATARSTRPAKEGNAYVGMRCAVEVK